MVDRGGRSLDFGYLACAAFEVHDDTVPAQLDPGQTAEVTVDVTTGAGGCAALTIIDWFAHYSGRSLRGTFDLDIAQ